MALKKQGKYRFNDVEVDLGNRSIRRGRHTVSVSPRTFDLLAYFLLHPQRVVRIEDLLDALWPGSNADETNLSQQVFLLRKALTGAQSGDKLIVTIPDRGYQFTPAVTPIGDGHSPLQPPRLRTLGYTATTATSVAEAEEEQESLPTLPGSELPNAADPASSLETGLKTDSDADSDPPPDLESDSGNPGRSGFFAALANSGPLLIVLVMALVAVLAWAGWQGWGWYQLHHPRPDSLGLMAGDFSNETGDGDFDESLKAAAVIDLHQSPFLRISAGPEVLAAFKTIQAPGRDNLESKVCRQLGDQAYLTGNIRRLAQKYLVSLEAHGCERGNQLARSIGIADTADAVVSVLDRVAADLRLQLGESSKSVAAFSKPLFPGREPSLDALKAYADARLLRQAGKTSDAIPLLNRAVELDPQFVLAIAELGEAESDLGDQEMVRRFLSRAYELRDTADDFDRYSIVAAYDNLVRGDLLDGIRNQKEARNHYPSNAVFPANLAQLYLQVGNPALAMEPAQQSIALNPGNPAVYATLARAYMHLNRYDEATATCRKAIEMHLDGPEIHGFLLQIAYMRLDQPGIDEQIAWAHSLQDDHAEAYMQMQRGLIAFADGKVNEAEGIFAKLAAEYRSQGLPDAAGRLEDSLPRMEAELGFLEKAQSQLLRLPSSDDSDLASIAVAWAEAGETVRATSMLKSALDAHMTGTLWQQQFGPQIRASVDLNQHQPDAAIEALAPAAALENRNFDVPALRGRAYLAAKHPDLAEREFHKILDHQGIDPLSYNYPLAQLGLARALAQQGKTAEAGFAYGLLFQIWKDADPDLPRLKAAKDEYVHLTGKPLPGKASAKPAAHTAPGKPSATRR